MGGRRARSTSSSTAPTCSRSTATPSSPASGCSSSTTCSPPAAPPRPPSLVEAPRRRRSSGSASCIELAGLGGRDTARASTDVDEPDLRTEGDWMADRRPGAALAPDISARPRRRSSAPLLAAVPAPPSRRRPSRRLISRAYERGGRRARGPDRASRASPTSTTRWRWPRIVADLGLDDITLAAALLHDAVEDTGVTLADVERELRRRGGRHRRRRHQARPAPVRLQGGAAGRHRCARCWWRWPRTSGS